jgi:hypothetical protein
MSKQQISKDLLVKHHMLASRCVLSPVGNMKESAADPSTARFSGTLFTHYHGSAVAVVAQRST